MAVVRGIAWTLSGAAAVAALVWLLRPGAEPAPPALETPAQARTAAQEPSPPAPLAPPSAAPEASPLAGAPATPVEERRAEEPGPRGKVVAAGTGEPLSGITVRLGTAFDTLAETVTGPDGTFLLPRPDKARRTVKVAAEGWRVKPRSVRLDEEQSAGAVELCFELERIVAAPFHGRLVDRLTGEPIPLFRFQARGPHRTEDIQSDEEGRFASAEGFEAGVLELVPYDHPSQKPDVPLSDGTLEHRHDFLVQAEAPEASIAIVIGPTYRFDLAFPAGLDAEDFHAAFVRATPSNRQLHRMTAEDPGSPVSLFFGQAASGASLEERAPLRDDAAPWARFRNPLLFWLSEPEAARTLHVRSADGWWSGSATVTSVQGIYPDTVAIDLAPRGSLEGVVLDPGGEPVRAAWIELRPGGSAGEPLGALGADKNGKFAFRWLDPGDYELSITSDRYDPWSASLSVHGGKTELVEARLSSGVALGSISGVLRGRTGQHRSGGGILTLVSLDDPTFFLSKTATLRKSDAGYAAAFTFKDVPVGPYELRLNPLDNRRWEPLRMAVQAPTEGLEFLCEDGGAEFDLGFRAVDAVTGEALADVESIVWHADPLQDARLDDDWESKLYEDVPEGAPLRWAARAPGYQIAEGNETALLVESAQRTIEARLTPGFGQLFKVTTREGAPLAGVELVVDGEPTGVSDGRGLLLLNRATSPAELAFRLPGWHVSWGTIDPRDEQFAWGLETPVYLARDE